MLVLNLSSIQMRSFQVKLFFNIKIRTLKINFWILQKRERDYFWGALKHFWSERISVTFYLSFLIFGLVVFLKMSNHCRLTIQFAVFIFSGNLQQLISFDREHFAEGNVLQSNQCIVIRYKVYEKNSTQELG